MTNEMKCFIEPEDILGVEFECGHCHARFLYRLPDAPIRILAECPNCHEGFYDLNKHESFKQFFALLTAMGRLTENSKMKIRIEVRPLNAEKSKSEQ